MSTAPRKTEDASDARRITRREAIATSGVAFGAGMLWGPSASAAPRVEASVAHTVTPATTNLTAVLGVFSRGPMNKAVLVTSWSDFASQFGGLDANLPSGTQPSMAVYALWQFFAGGGIGAWVVRLDNPSSAAAQVTVSPLILQAFSPGAWADGLLVELQPSRGAKQLVGATPGTPDLVDLLVTSPAPGGQTVVTEVVSGLTADAKGAVSAAINNSSFYVTAAAPAEPITPDSKPFEGSSVTVGGLTLTTPVAWSPAAALTATITASAAGWWISPSRAPLACCSRPSRSCRMTVPRRAWPRSSRSSPAT